MKFYLALGIVLLVAGCAELSVPLNVPMPFTRLTDTPNSYGSDSNFLVSVNSSATGLVFIPRSDVNGGSGGSGLFYDPTKLDLNGSNQASWLPSVSLVPNLNADLLDGLHASAFLTPAQGDGNYIRLNGSNDTLISDNIYFPRGITIPKSPKDYGIDGNGVIFDQNNGMLVSDGVYLILTTPATTAPSGPESKGIFIKPNLTGPNFMVTGAVGGTQEVFISGGDNNTDGGAGGVVQIVGGSGMGVHDSGPSGGDVSIVGGTGVLGTGFTHGTGGRVNLLGGGGTFGSTGYALVGFTSSTPARMCSSIVGCAQQDFFVAGNSELGGDNFRLGIGTIFNKESFRDSVPLGFGTGGGATTGTQRVNRPDVNIAYEPTGGGTFYFEKGLGTGINFSKIQINSQANDINFTIGALNDRNAFFVRGKDANVGLGTDLPNKKLTVVGDVNATNSVYAGNAFYNKGIVGLTKTLLVRAAGGASDCSIDVNGGIITASTC